MKKRMLLTLCFLVSVAMTSVACGGGSNSSNTLDDIPASRIDAQKTVVHNGKKYTYVKYKDENGEEKSGVFDDKGKPVDPSTLTQPPANPIGGDLDNVLKNVAPDIQGQDIRVIVELKDDVELPDAPIISGGTDEHGKSILLINGKPATQAEIDELNKKQDQIIDKYNKARKEKRKKLLAKLIADNHLTVPKEVQDGYISGDEPLVIELPINQIKSFLEKNKDIIRFIEKEPEAATTSLKSAMIATDVTGTVLPKSDYQGAGIGVYMTEPECSDYISYSSGDNGSGGTSSLNAASPTGSYNNRDMRYRVLGSSSCNAPHPLNVGSIIRAVSPQSYIYCRSGSHLPYDSDLQLTDPPISVVSASFRYVVKDTGYTYWDKQWDDFIYNKSILAVVAAGNEGYGDGYVTPPSRGLNVLTVGNYDDANNGINYSSSWRDPSDTQNTKPEVSAPGTYIDAGFSYLPQSEQLTKVVMTGTSQAAPHVSGIVADLISHIPDLKGRPQLQKAYVLAGALDPIYGGKDKTGLGGVDIGKTIGWSTYRWWYGGNSSFSWFDARDPYPNNGKIDTNFYLPGNKKIRIVLTWLNRGEWTYSHRNSDHPIGMDLDFTVYDPNGKVVGGSSSWDNGFESTEFDSTMSGNYHIEIRRFANRDTASQLRMALVAVAN